MRPAGISTLLLATGLLVFFAASGPNAGAQTTGPANGTLAEVTVSAVPSLGVPPYNGTLGAESATGPTRTSTWAGDDPDGVLAHVGGWYGGPAGPGSSTASVNDPAGVREAQTSWSGIGFRLTENTPNIVSLGAVHTYARCTQAPLQPSAQAYAATDSNPVYLFDDVTKPVADGTSTYPVTGAQLGYPEVGSGTLTITA